MPAVWDELANQEKKTLLRSLIQRVILTRVEADQVDLRVVWVSGHYSSFEVRVGTRQNSDLPHYDEMMALIHHLWQQGVDDKAIAAELAAQGYHSARSDRFSAASVGRLRLQHGWRRVNVRDNATMEGHLSINELAEVLHVSRFWIYNRIRSGRIAAEFVSRHPEHDRLYVRNDPDLLAALRAMKKNARSQ